MRSFHFAVAGFLPLSKYPAEQLSGVVQPSVSLAALQLEIMLACSHSFIGYFNSRAWRCCLYYCLYAALLLFFIRARACG